MLHRLLPVAILGSALAAGQSSWTGPLQGFIFDSPTRSVRPILGIAGSAYVGQAVLSGLDAAWVAPGKQHGIAVRNNQVVFFSALGSESPAVAPLDGAAGNPDGVSWSADGSIAVLYSGAGSWIQKFAHLPDAPVATSTVDLSPLGGTISVVACDAAGNRFAAGIRGDSGSGVYLGADGQFPVMQIAMADPEALAFSNSTNSLYAVDRSAGQVFELQSSGAYAQILGKQDGVDDPIAIRPGQDGQGRSLLYLASHADLTVRIYAASDYSFVSEIPLDSPPSGLDPLDDSSYLVSARTKIGDALWLFSGKPSPMVYFVPPPSDSLGGLQ